MEVYKEILLLLSDDILSCGLFFQELKILMPEIEENFDNISIAAIEKILTPGEIEVGYTRMQDSGYVEFCAWQGSVAARIGKAMSCFYSASAEDKEFAFWFCLSKNVDRYEAI